jgi:glycosyltransferase involved in cell wall biosynthesis
MSKRLLIIGNDSIHILNFIELIEDYFDDILLITNKKNLEWGIKSVEVNFSIRRDGYKNLINLRNIIDDFNPTIVHIHQADTKALLTLLAIRRKSILKVLTAWGSDILLIPKQSIFLKWKSRYILKNIDVLTADSDIVLKEAQNIVKLKLKSYNINFGVDFYNCDRKKENIIYSNRLHSKLYNIDKIITSFSKFIERGNYDWKLIIAGVGNQTDFFKELVSKLKIENNVKFIGWVDAKTNYEYYCKSKIYVSVPQSDSISISLVESIVSNCIVFVSELPANREIITKNIGFFVDDLNNIDFLKFQEIDRELYDKEKMKVLNKFSKAENRLKYLNIYEEYQ